MEAYNVGLREEALAGLRDLIIIAMFSAPRRERLEVCFEDSILEALSVVYLEGKAGRQMIGFQWLSWTRAG